MTDSASSPSPRPRWKRRLWLGLVAVLVLVGGGLYVWKLVAVSRVESAMEAQRDSLVRAADDRVERRTRELLRMSAVPLGFAVREPVLAENFGLVDQYLSALVQEPGVRQALIVDRSDSVLVATDRDLRGTRIPAGLLPDDLLPASEPEVRTGAAGSYFAAVPLTGINRRVGTLIVEYRPDDPVSGPAGAPAGSTPAGSGPGTPETSSGPPPG